MRKSGDATHFATDGPAPRRYDGYTTAARVRVPVFVRSEKSNALVGTGGFPQPAPRSANLSTALSVACIKLLYGPGIAFPGLARLRDIVDMVGLYNI